jgi:hypothetical protein
MLLLDGKFAERIISEASTTVVHMLNRIIPDTVKDKRHLPIVFTSALLGRILTSRDVL